MKWKYMILAAIAVVLPAGQRYEMSHDTCRVRSCFTWSGIQISRYIEETNPMSDWIRNDLEFQPKSEDWSAMTGGPFLLSYRVGTPEGNWIFLHNLYDRYSQVSDQERTKISQHAKRILNAKTWKEKIELNQTHYNSVLSS